MDRIAPVEILQIKDKEKFTASSNSSPKLSMAHPVTSSNLSNQVEEHDYRKGNVFVIQVPRTPPKKPPRLHIDPPSIIVTSPESPHMTLSPTSSFFAGDGKFDMLLKTQSLILGKRKKGKASVMEHNGKISQQIFEVAYPLNGNYWDGCITGTITGRITQVWELNRKHDENVPLLELKQLMPPCFSCFEEETTKIDIYEGKDEDTPIATITQKKTWVGSRVDREILIEPRLHTKADSFIAYFNWDDTCINLKSFRRGVVMATLNINHKDEENQILHFLRDLRSFDKAILLGFMISREALVEDESKKRRIGERVTMVVIVLAFIVITSYFLLPS